MKLPLVEFTKALYSKHNSKQDVGLIAIQHLLGTTHDMFNSLVSFGVKPQKICVLGKCYSTHVKTASCMKKAGIYVSPFSTAFDSHTPFDSFFEKNILSFLNESFERLGNVDRYIILDDGGHLISMILKHFKHLAPKIVAIEQTSSGYESLEKQTHLFPILNVAHSSLKRHYEPLWIARLVHTQLMKNLSLNELKSKRILILGNGAIGMAFHFLLKPQFDVTIYEKNDPNRPNFETALSQADVIIGCTGMTSLPHTKHLLLKKSCLLVSASSSDREFDSVYLRRESMHYTDCHRNLSVGGIQLLNSGFPINFTGQKHSVSPAKIQLVRALLIASILEAQKLQQIDPGFISLDKNIHQAIGYCFTSLYAKIPT